MKVTRIEEISKSRSKVWLEQEPPFVVYKGELRSYHICEGEEIAQADYEEIMQQVLPKRAKLRAMNLLQKREYTVKQLYCKLKEGYYPEEVIAQALAYVAGYHYTDDLRYAEHYIMLHEANKSRRRIEQDLQGKGIEKAVLEQAFLQWEEKGGGQDEMEMITRLLQKKHYNPEKADFKEKQKMYGFLMRKGFPGEAVRRALDCYEDM